MLSYLQTNNRHRWWKTSKGSTKLLSEGLILFTAALSVFPLWSDLSNTSHFIIPTSKHQPHYSSPASLSVRLNHSLGVFPKGLLNRQMAHHDLLITCFIKRLICFDSLAYSVHARSELSNSNIASASCTSDVPSESTVHMTSGMETCQESVAGHLIRGERKQAQINKS